MCTTIEPVKKKKQTLLWLWSFKISPLIFVLTCLDMLHSMKWPWLDDYKDQWCTANMAAFLEGNKIVFNH